MKNKGLFWVSLLLLLCVPMLFFVFSVTRVPHTLLPNVPDGSPPVPEVPAGMEYAEAGGLLGAGLYLLGGIAGILGMVFSRRKRAGPCTAVGAVLLCGLCGSAWLLRELFFLTMLPLTVLSVLYLFFSCRRGSGA